jgi:beta-lactamase regulating signal transducer with metallopeptidase domain
MLLSVAAYACLSLIFHYAAPWLSDRVHPSLGARLVGSGTVAVAAAGVFVLSATAFVWMAQRPAIAEVGKWSPTKLRAADPVPPSLAVVCAVLVALAVASMTARLVRRLRCMADVRRAAGRGTERGQILVLTDERAEAFATPGRRGRIVVTSGLLDALTEPERQALLAHERSHLRHGHVWWILAADVAGAANPLLRRPARTVRHAVERWADEDAARDVADRRLVARTLARVSLLKKHGAGFAFDVALRAAAGDVTQRVRAMLGPRPRRNLFATACLALMVIAAIAAAATVQHIADGLFDAAQVTAA